MSITLSDEDVDRLIRAALDEARQALSEGEAPIGAVIAVRENDSIRIVARGHNRINALRRKTAHAEMVAFEAAGVGPNGEAAALPADAKEIILASTLEPCVMCFGAAMEAGVELILYSLRAPSNNGTTHVRPPESPESSLPSILGGYRADESRALFERWMATQSERHPEQAAFVRQLLDTIR